MRFLMYLGIRVFNGQRETTFIETEKFELKSIMSRITLETAAKYTLLCLSKKIRFILYPLSIHTNEEVSGYRTAILLSIHIFKRLTQQQWTHSALTTRHKMKTLPQNILKRFFLVQLCVSKTDIIGTSNSYSW